MNRVQDESAVLGDLVVEAAGGAVGFLGRPVDPAAIAGLRPVGHGGDQGAGDAAAAGLGSGEEVLQVADVRRRGAGVGQEMRDADQVPVDFRAEGVHSLIGGEFRPGMIEEFSRHVSSVEFVVTREQLLPVGAVGVAESFDGEGHSIS